MPNRSVVPQFLRRHSTIRYHIWLLLLLSPLISYATPLDDATALFDNRRYAEAEAAFTALHAKHPDHPQVLLYLGKLAAKRQNRPQAIAYLSRAVEINPDNAELQFEYGAACGLYAGTLGTSFSALRHARRASKAMQRAIELEPDNLTFRQGMIEFSLNAPAIAGGGRSRAYDQADAIAERDPAKGAFARASLQRSEGNHTAAMQTLDELIVMAPDNYFALFNFGRCAAESGERLAEGLARLQRCLELPAPDQAAPPAEVWWNIASIEKQRNNRRAAITALEKAAALAPHHTSIADDLTSYLAAES